MKIKTDPREPRILFIIDQIFSATGGSEQHLSFLLKTLPSKNIKTYLIILRHTEYSRTLDTSVFPGNHVVLNFESFYSPIGLWKSVHRIVHFIKLKKIDVIHTFFQDSEILGILASRISRSCTIVSSRRNMGYWHTQSSLLRTRFTNRFIPRFIANCHAVKEYIAKLEFIPPSKIEIIYNPVFKDRISELPLNPPTRQDFNLEQEDFVIGMVANIRPIKDHLTFFRASRIVLDQYKNVKFLIIGSFSDENYTKNLHLIISSLGLDNAVIFTDEIQNPVPLMRILDIGVLTSKSEGLSNSLIELSAVGLPTVATDVGGNSEIIVHGRSGFVTPVSDFKAVADGIIQLLSDNEMRKSFGDFAKKFVQDKFDPDIILSKYKNFYFSFIDSPI